MVAFSIFLAIAPLGWIVQGVNAALRNVTVMATQSNGAIQFNGNWTLQNDWCAGTNYASNVGDYFTYTFNGVAIYVIGTEDCNWSGIIQFTLDGDYKAQFNRRACIGKQICDYVWYSATDLEPTNHTINVALTGPPVSEAPSGHIIADLRYLIYTVDDGNGSGSDGQSSGKSSSSNLGAIVGGSIGGVAALLILLAILLFFYWRRKREPEPEDEQPQDVPGFAQVDPYQTGQAMSGQPGVNYAVLSSAGSTVPSQYYDSSIKQRPDSSQRTGTTPQDTQASSSSGPANAPWNPYVVNDAGFGGFVNEKGGRRSSVDGNAPARDNTLSPPPQYHDLFTKRS